MVGVADLGIAHHVRDTERLPYLVPGGRTRERADVAQPFHLGVFNHEQRARRDHADEHVVVEGQQIGRIAELLERFPEPDILGDDLREGLPGLLRRV